MLPHGSHVARFAGDHSQKVAEALTANHYALRERASTHSLGLTFPYGAHWVYCEIDTGYCVSITLHHEVGSTWLLTIRPDTPVRPQVVRRGASRNSSSAGAAAVCLAIAQTLHAVLFPLCSDLRWGTDDGPDSIIDSVEPVLPREN